ncbi:DUF6048 family protein [Myroides sp. LJL119]
MKLQIKTKHILKSFISLGLFLATSISAVGQQVEIQTQKEILPESDSKKQFITVYPQRYGLNVGIDLYRLTRSMYDKSYNGFELVGDYRLTKNWYLAAEIGNEKSTRNNNTFGYSASGSFIKLGANFNLYENWLNAEDQIYIGFRYGFSNFSQTLDWYKIYTTDPYFPSQRIDANKKYSGLSAHWVEFVTGIQTRLFNNVFMGFSLRLNGLLTQKQPQDFENLYIPGFNKKHSGSIGVGFNYTLTYFIPLYKSKIKKPVEVPFVEPKYDLQGNEIQAQEIQYIENNKKQIKQ